VLLVVALVTWSLHAEQVVGWEGLAVCSAVGAETEDEASLMAQDLLKTIIGDHMKHLQPLPCAKKRRGSKYRLISLPALQSAKVELYREFLQSSLRKADLARRVGAAKSNIDRLFDLRHASRLEQIENAFRALGKRLVIDVSDAR
jgi:antitoxin HicB